MELSLQLNSTPTGDWTSGRCSAQPDEVAVGGNDGARDEEKARGANRKCWLCGQMGHLAQDCTLTEQEGRDRLRAEAGTTRETRSTSDQASDSVTPCINCGQYGHNKFRCPNPPVERKIAGREGLKTAGQALVCRAMPGCNPSVDLPKMERVGDHDGDIFMMDESGNIWWRNR